MDDVPGRHAENDVGARGRLEIADRAVTTLVRRATLDVPGVAPSDASGSVERALGRGYPRISVHRAGQHVRVGVDLAVVWPGPAGKVAGDVQNAIAHGLTQLAGLVVDGVDVTVRTVQHAASAVERRVQ